MRCEYCDEDLRLDEPENVVLLRHLGQSEPCTEQFDMHLENLRSSWTRAMSGG